MPWYLYVKTKDGGEHSIPLGNKEEAESALFETMQNMTDPPAGGVAKIARVFVVRVDEITSAQIFFDEAR